MSKQLFPVVSRPVGPATIPTVDARELHTFLECGEQFDKWIKQRIEQFDFVENQDFVTYRENSLKGRPRIEYALTLSMGKELSMVERNAKGKQARQYFIECERIAKDPIALLNDPAILKTLLLDNLEKVLDLETKVGERDKMIAVTAPKAAALDKIALADGSLSLTDAAKTIGVQPQKEFLPRLCAAKWIYRRAGGDHWVAYQDKIQQMLLEHKVTTIARGDGSEKITEQVRVTPKGLAKLAMMFTGRGVQ
jgi:anti-repressor protein